MAELKMRFPGGLAKSFTMSYDDGVEQDKKLASIMKKHGLKGTFNLNSGIYAKKGTVYAPGTIHRRMDEEEVSKLYKEDGFEVASHAFTHPFLERIPTYQVATEILKDREKLESQFDTIVRGFAYPFGTFNDEVVNILKECGIAYARTVHSTRLFKMPQNWLLLDPTCHHDDEKLFELADKFINAKDDYGYPMMFYLWGHAYEFEANNNWDRIEKFAEVISGKEDVWYATNIEICEYTEDFKRLRTNVSFTKVYNPTARTIWFTYRDKPYKIGPGEELSI